MSGIVYTLAGLELIHMLRSELGIPAPYNTPEELVPAAFDLLIGRDSSLTANRFTAHRDCARAGRAVLLDVQGLDFDHPVGLTDDDLKEWLARVESTFEIYRSAYRALTGTDLGRTTTPVVPQAA